jgi:PAS domain S-box-containing protein
VNVEALVIAGTSGLDRFNDLDPATLDAIPSAISVCAEDGTVLRCNRSAIRLWGKIPATGQKFTGALRYYRADGRPMPRLEHPVAIVLRTGEPLHDQQIQYGRPDGSSIAVILDVEPLISPDGRIEGAVASFRELKQPVQAPESGNRTYRDILDVVPAAIYATDAEGTITFYNRAAVHFAGRVPEIGKDKWCVSWRLLGADGQPLAHDKCPMAVALKEQRAVPGIDACALRPDGRRIPFMAYPTPIYDERGRLTGAVNMLVDISERKQDEAKLETQASLLTSMNAITRTLSKDLDLERIVQEVTDSATRLSGAKFGAFFYNVTDASGERYVPYILSGAPGSAFEKFGLPRSTAIFDRTFQGEGIIRSGDIRKDPRYGRSAPYPGMPRGHLPIVSYLAVPVVSRSGKVHGGLFFGHDRPDVFTRESEDVVAAIAAQAGVAIDNARLFEAAQELAAIVEFSADAIVSKDLNGIIKSWNKGAERIFGYTASEVIGKPVLMLIPENLQDEEPKILERIRRGDRIEHYETIRRHKSGRLIDVSLSVSPVKNAQGKVTGASKIARDIGVRKRAEHALASRMEEQAALYELTDRLNRADSLTAIYDAALAAIIRALGCQRASILLLDENKVMRFAAWRGLSETYRRVTEGHSPWGADVKEPKAIAIADIRDADLPQSLKDCVFAEGIVALAFIPIVWQGRLIGKFMTYYGAPHAFTDDELHLAVTVARQLAFAVERKRADEELRSNEERLRLATQAGKVGIWDWDISKNRITWSDSLYPMHGVNNANFDGTVEAFSRLVHSGEHSRVAAAIEKSLNDDTPCELEFRAVKPDGEIAWLYTNATVLREGGKPVRMLGATLDITERKQADAHRDLLVAELSHRVKNTLATVMSIARQSLVKDSFEDGRRSFTGRIQAMAHAHTRLAEKNWSGVSLETLISDELAPYRREDCANVRMSGPAVSLNPKCAVMMGMAVHELATNAAKYGAFSMPSGVVTISWELVAPRQLRLRWEESGGPAVKPEPRSGFGRLLLERALTSDLRGKVQMDFAPKGLRCEISFPLEGQQGVLDTGQSSV